MKTILPALIVILSARIVFFIGMIIFTLPFGTIFGAWQHYGPTKMIKARRAVTSLGYFIGSFVALIATVVFSFYIFDYFALINVPRFIPIITVLIPMIFSVRADAKDWKKNKDAVWGEQNDLSLEMRLNMDIECICMHRMGVFAKIIGILASFLYFGVIGDEHILPYLGID